MKARTDVEVGLDARGHTVVRRLHCEVPLLVREADEPGPTLALLLVNGAAGPLGGDVLRFRLTVADGASVRVRSVAASMAQPGPRGDPSSLHVEVTVGSGASLDWCPQPTISVEGSVHRTVTTLLAAPDSTIRWTDDIVLGRHREPPGTILQRLRLEVGDDVVLDHDLHLADGALRGPGANGPYRMLRSALLVADDAPREATTHTDGCALHGTFPLAPRCALITTLTD